MKLFLAWLAVVAFGLVSAPVAAVPDTHAAAASVSCVERGDCCDKGVPDASCMRCCVALPAQFGSISPFLPSGGMIVAVEQSRLTSRLSPPATPPPRRQA